MDAMGISILRIDDCEGENSDVLFLVKSESKGTILEWTGNEAAIFKVDQTLSTVSASACSAQVISVTK
jgi:hypothetical protein